MKNVDLDEIVKIFNIKPDTYKRKKITFKELIDVHLKLKNRSWIRPLINTKKPAVIYFKKH